MSRSFYFVDGSPIENYDERFSSNDDPSTFEPIESYDDDEEINSDIEVKEI